MKNDSYRIRMAQWEAEHLWDIYGISKPDELCLEDIAFTTSFLSVEILAMERYETFVLEQLRPFDDAYQKDHDRYMAHIQAVLKRLAVRADCKVKETINTLRIRINNRGRAEVLTVDNTIYFDIAILDLLEHAALEFAIADINVDDYQGLEFNVSYSVALSTDKLLRGVDPYNHARLEKEQWETLWEDVKRYQQVFCHNCLAFILAHEIGHMVLGHNDRLNREFPTENHKKSNPEKWNRLRRNLWKQNPDPFFSSKSQFLEVVCGSKPTFAMVYHNLVIVT